MDTFIKLSLELVGYCVLSCEVRMGRILWHFSRQEMGQSIFLVLGGAMLSYTIAISGMGGMPASFATVFMNSIPFLIVLVFAGISS